MIEFMIILGILFGGIAVLAVVAMTAPKWPPRTEIPTPPRRHHLVNQGEQPEVDVTWVVGRPAHALKRDAT